MNERDNTPTVRHASPHSSRYIFSGSRAAQAAFDHRTVDADLGFLLPYLKPGMRVVDCGCGAGAISLGLAEVVAPGEVVGFDLSAPAIDTARARAATRGVTNVRFEVGNVYASGLPDTAFDVALFSGVLAHLAEPAQALQEAYRLLEPGGLLGAREPEKHGDWAAGRCSDAITQLNALVIEQWQAAGGDPFLGGRLKSLLRQVGFAGVQAHPSFSPALSSVAVIGTVALRRLKEEESGRRLGVGADRVEQLVEEIRQWMSDEASVAAMSECVALGWKPHGEW